MKRILIASVVTAMVASSTAALASGSSPRGGHRSDWGTQVREGKNSRISKEDRLIRVGRSQVRKRITCTQCEYNGKLNRTTAPEIAQAVRDGRFDIKPSHRKAVLLFLQDRFDI